MRLEFDQPNSFSKLIIVGNNHLILLEDEIPEWKEEKENIPDLPEEQKEELIESCFHYKGNLYFLSEFMYIDKRDKNNPFKDFDGYISDSFFSGILIKLIDDDNDHVKAYWYMS